MSVSHPIVIPPPSLLDASKRLATVMRQGGVGYGAAADQIDSYDSQPYPLTYVMMSQVVSDFLRAIEAEDAIEPAMQRIAEQAGAALGPPLRQVV